MMKFIFLFLLILVMALFISGTVSPKTDYGELKVDVAMAVAEEINGLNLSTINTTAVSSVENVQNMVEGLNKLTGIINDKTKFKIKLLVLTDEVLKKTAETGDFFLKYGPIIKPYNDLIEESRVFNAVNESSINAMYVNMGLLSVDIIILDAEITKNAAWHSGKYIFRTADTFIDPQTIRVLQEYCGSQCVAELRATVSGWIDRELTTAFFTAQETVKEQVVPKINSTTLSQFWKTVVE